MEDKDLYPTDPKRIENMIIEQKERLSKKYDTTRADLVKMLIDARRENDAAEDPAMRG